MTDKQSVVIIGGGPAGLTAAWELIKDGGADKYDVTVLEGTREFGGISRTVKHNGNRMDIGGHRFFSKDDRIMDWWKDVLPLQSFSIARRIFCSVTVSTELVASSSINMGAFVSTARAIVISCLSPCESSAPPCSSTVS